MKRVINGLTLLATQCVKGLGVPEYSSFNFHEQALRQIANKNRNNSLIIETFRTSRRKLMLCKS